MSQRPRSQVKASQGPPSEENIASAERAVHFFLAHAGAHNSTIKYLDLKKCVFPDTKVDEPLRLATKMLKDTFGYDLVTHQESNKSKVYYLVNNFSNEGHIIFPESSKGYRTLLSLILSFIFMNRGPVEQKNLLKFLRQMSIDIDRPHPFFGDVADLIYKPNPTFVKDLFLTLNESEQGIFYSWGPRAENEVDRKAVLEFACEIMGCDINDWKLHLKDCESPEMDES